MNNLWLGIKFALGYFTLLPVRFGDNEDLSSSAVLRSMLASFPAIGALLAGLSILLFLLLEPLGWIGALLAAGSYMVLYGFLHTEAVIDVADALHAAHGGKDPYAIIKEPTVGAMGVLYGTLFVLFKTAALSSLLMHHHFALFVAIAIISRLGLLVILSRFTFRSVFASQLGGALTLPLLSGLLAAYVLAGTLLLASTFPLWMAGGIAAALLLALFMKRSLGFLNGDTLGAALEGSELILIVGVLALWS